MGKSALILILGSITLFGVYNNNMNNYIWWGSKVMVERYAEIQAKQAANSMVTILLAELADDIDFRVEPARTEELFEVALEYTITDTMLVSPDSLIMIKVKAVFEEQSYSVRAFTATLSGWVPPFVRGAWTANADLNNTISDMYIDGRDHDLDLNIIPGSGNFAVSSATNFTNVDNASIGGSYMGVDYPMTNPENPLIIEQNVDWGGAFPTTPDEILGYPEGTLKSIAQSGRGGSQYVLNPGDKIDTGDLIFPLSGVTYVEITDGTEGKFKSPTDSPGMNDEGILIFHAPDGSSRVKEISGAKTKGTTLNYFTGLMIADYSFHHHIDILGAVLQLSPNLEGKKKCNGNKDHWVYYSSKAIENATSFVAEETGTLGNAGSAEGGFGTGRKKVLFWYE